MTEKTVQPVPTGFFIPPHTGGDQEFKGHGPTTYVRVEIEIRDKNEIWAQVYMRSRETKKDWTAAEGTAGFKIHSHNRPIIDIVSSIVQDHRYTDTNHDMDVFSFPPQNLISRMECVGDTKGNEAGMRTGCQIFFHPIRIMEVD